MSEIRFSVLMPTYNQCAFIRRAILSLMQQTYDKWELIIINDGCTDETEEFIADYLADERITYIKNEENTGLGHALNQGLDAARYDYIAYLPSDDYYFANHLFTLKQKFESDDSAILVYTGMQYETHDSLFRISDTKCVGIRKGYWLQLVQTAHKRTADRWTERSEWTSEDLFAMFWRKLSGQGFFVTTSQITAYWTQHPKQRHKLVSEKYGGGLNKFRSHYRPRQPLKLRISKEKFWDEETIYRDFRKPCQLSEHPLKILLVGELAYNPERIYALEEAGHKLYGLWIPKPNLSFCHVGPLPFGNVEDVNPDHWQEEVRRIQPDIIYGMLNSGVVWWAYEVMRTFPEIPFAWHLKECPQASIRIGNFDELIYLYRHAAVRIYLNEVVKKWFDLFIPSEGDDFDLLLDGDLPKREYFKSDFSEKLSAQDGEIHTLVVGRMVGLGESGLHVLAREHVHVHLYTENYHASREKLLNHYREAFPHTFHIHNHVAPPGWTREFSKYDAGWMHGIHSTNKGNLLHATWDDLNLPARISTYMAAGLPVIHSDNSDHTVAMEQRIDELGIGICYHDLSNLVAQLKNHQQMAAVQANVMLHRMEFCFDTHVPELISAFRKAINRNKQTINHYY